MRPNLPAPRLVQLPGRGWLPVRFHESPSTRPPVLLLHGWSVGGDLNWFPALPALESFGSFAWFDHRSHASGLRGARSLEQLSLDALAVADALGFSKFIVAGYSMGGAVAQILARDHPDRVSGLVLASTAARFTFDGFRFSVFESPFALARLGARLAGLSPSILHRLTADVIYGRKLPKHLGPWVRSQLLEHEWRGILYLASDLGRFDSRPWLGKVSQPAALVCSTGDHLVLPALQRELAAALPGLVSSFDLASGHDAIFTDQEAFNRALSGALAAVSPPKSV